MDAGSSRGGGGVGSGRVRGGGIGRGGGNHGNQANENGGNLKTSEHDEEGCWFVEVRTLLPVWVLL